MWYLGGTNHPCMQGQDLADGQHPLPYQDTLLKI